MTGSPSEHSDQSISAARRPRNAAASDSRRSRNGDLWRAILPFLAVALIGYFASRTGDPVPAQPSVSVSAPAEVYGAAVEPAVAVPTRHGSDVFSLPPELRHAVSFWQQVFGVWRATQFALHDRDHLGVIYDVVDLPRGSTYKLTAEQRRLLEQRRNRIESDLIELERRLKRRVGLSAEQQRLYDLIKRGAGRDAVAGSAARLRAQRGMRESFRQGLEASSRYREVFRQVFREAGLPEDLAHVPHVESAFTAGARSPAGAVGVWQFMPATGRRFLRMDEALDERYDPVFATRGAARYFADAYAKLGDWALAVTAYNHGLAGVVRAKDRCGADIVCIVRRYESPTFGFASRNFYAEFLAVRGIVHNLAQFFPEGVGQQAPLAHRRVRLLRPLPATRLAQWHGIDTADLAALNPAWTKDAVRGRVELPADADVWLPRDRVKRTRHMDRYYTQPDRLIGRLSTRSDARSG